MTSRGRSVPEAASHTDRDEPGMVSSSLWHSAAAWMGAPGPCGSAAALPGGAARRLRSRRLLGGTGGRDACPAPGGPGGRRGKAYHAIAARGRRNAAPRPVPIRTVDGGSTGQPQGQSTAARSRVSSRSSFQAPSAPQAGHAAVKTTASGRPAGCASRAPGTGRPSRGAAAAGEPCRGAGSAGTAAPSWAAALGEPSVRRRPLRAVAGRALAARAGPAPPGGERRQRLHWHLLRARPWSRRPIIGHRHAPVAHSPACPAGRVGPPLSPQAGVGSTGRAGAARPARPTERGERTTVLRTHEAGSLRAEHAGQTVTLAGWVARRRDHGGVAFIDLRDASGVVQVVIRDEAVAHDLRNEFCLRVTGEVRRRPAGNENPAPAHRRGRGRRRPSVEVLNEAAPLPFPIDEHVEVGEEARLRYRYLDLRRAGPARGDPAAQRGQPGGPRGAARRAASSRSRRRR